jgi:GTP-binding protein
MPVSAANGRGMGELLDEIVERLPEETAPPSSEDEIRVAVVGRPNVGKSSFVNYLLGEQRHIVSDIPGTTRDSIDSSIEIDGRRYVLVDTAGLRRRSRVKESIEYYTTLRTLRAIQRCDIAVILLDAHEGLNFQELKIIEEVGENRRGMVLAINKWDIFEKDERSSEIYSRQIKEAAPTYSYIPTVFISAVFISALRGKRVRKTMELVDRVYHEFNKRIATSALNDFLESAVSRQPPPAAYGKWIKLYYMTQPDTAPPTFVIFSNYPKLIQEPYIRYLTNRMREQFGFEGVPIRIKLKPRGTGEK